MASCSDDDRDAMPSTPDTAGRDRNGGDEEKTRQVVLEKELQGVRNINETIEGVIASLEKAKGNMDVSVTFQSGENYQMLTRLKYS